jgi:hypothetical protein
MKLTARSRFERQVKGLNDMARSNGTDVCISTAGAQRDGVAHAQSALHPAWWYYADAACVVQCTE